jgi:hypothetical protein
MGKWLEPVRRPALVTQVAGGGDSLNCQTRHFSRSVTVRRQSGSKEFRGEALQRHTACPHCSVLLPTILHRTLRLSVYGGDYVIQPLLPEPALASWNDARLFTFWCISLRSSCTCLVTCLLNVGRGVQEPAVSKVCAVLGQSHRSKQQAPETRWQASRRVRRRHQVIRGGDGCRPVIVPFVPCLHET